MNFDKSSLPRSSGSPRRGITGQDKGMLRLQMVETDNVCTIFARFLFGARFLGVRKTVRATHGPLHFPMETVILAKSRNGRQSRA
jgi:hypothetical protein